MLLTRHLIKSRFTRALLFIAISSSALGIAQSKNEEQSKPNIILIMADDLGQETLGIYGSDSYATPNLDRLANEGMRFDQCYSTPLCTPSRVQLMTGRYSHRNYIGFGLLDPNEKTFGHYMQASGYKTFIAGKWQLLGNAHQQKLAGNKIGSTPEQAGFDAYCLWQIDERGTRYKDPLLSIGGKGTIQFPGRYGPDIFVEHIEAFMEENKNDPMFIYYPMVLTHDPFVPTPDSPEFRNFDATSQVNDPAYFGEMVHYMDKLIGNIVQKTEELGIRENTLILFIGDNGTDRDVTSIVNGSPLRGDKGHTTNAGTQVPFIANWKGRIKQGSNNTNLVDFTDFLPTLLQVSGQQPLPKSEADGHSFYDQLFGKNKNAREWIFCHYAPFWGKFEPRRYVQNKDWKLYGSGEFYNLAKDSLEKNPLNLEEQTTSVQATVAKFQSVLNQYAK